MRWFGYADGTRTLPTAGTEMPRGRPNAAPRPLTTLVFSRGIGPAAGQ